MIRKSLSFISNLYQIYLYRLHRFVTPRGTTNPLFLYIELIQTGYASPCFTEESYVRRFKHLQ